MADNFDKFLPDWQIGTLTLAANSIGFTAADALLTFGSIQQGDFIISPDGRMLVIESIADDNNGVLSSPCPPEAAGTFPTRIRYQSDNSRYTGQTAALRRLMSGGNLFALAKLAGDTETVIRFLGNGAFDLVDPSEFGIQDPNGSLAKLAAFILAANKAIVTDDEGNAQQIDLGSLGRALIVLSLGTNAQYIQGDGTLQAKAGLPVSTATQAALNAKANLSGASFTGSISSTAGLAVGTSITAGGVGQGKLYFRNDANINIIDMGVGSGTGYGNSFGIYNTSDGEFAVFTQGARRFTVAGAGNVAVAGYFSASSKSYLIDHPKDPYNKDLRFMSTEAPKAGVEFWGTVRLVNGLAEVDIDVASNLTPGTFSALTQNAFVVSVNNLDEPTYVHGGRIVEGKFTLQADGPVNCEVSWHVKAERADAFIKSHPYCDPNSGVLTPEAEKEDFVVSGY
ncbi:hypothetical protein ABE530_04165 [Brucella sp. TWI559]